MQDKFLIEHCKQKYTEVSIKWEHALSKGDISFFNYLQGLLDIYVSFKKIDKDSVDIKSSIGRVFEKLNSFSSCEHRKQGRETAYKELLEQFPQFAT